jgi:hypothetical protein
VKHDAQRTDCRPVLAEMHRTLDDSSREYLAAVRALRQAVKVLTTEPSRLASLETCQQAELAFAIVQAAWDALYELWEWERSAVHDRGPLPDHAGDCRATQLRGNHHPPLVREVDLQRFLDQSANRPADETER